MGNSTIKKPRATVHPDQSIIRLQAGRKGIPNMQEDGRASKKYNVTTSIPGTKEPAESHMAGTTVMANTASTVVPSVRCTNRQTHTPRCLVQLPIYNERPAY